MKREVLLKEMKDSVGTKDPVEYFAKMADVFSLLFDHIDSLQKDVTRSKMLMALAIHWEPRVASVMIADEVTKLRLNKDVYVSEITALKQAYADDVVTQSYDSFCNFWVGTLGWHPFLDSL